MVTLGSPKKKKLYSTQALKISVGKRIDTLHVPEQLVNKKKVDSEVRFCLGSVQNLTLFSFLLNNKYTKISRNIYKVNCMYTEIEMAFVYNDFINVPQKLCTYLPITYKVHIS